MWWGIVVISGFLEGLGLYYKKPIFICHIFVHCPTSFSPQSCGSVVVRCPTYKKFQSTTFFPFYSQHSIQRKKTFCQPLADSCVPLNCGFFFILKKISLPPVRGCLCTYQVELVKSFVPSEVCYRISLALEKMILPININISMHCHLNRSLYSEYTL